MLSSMRFQQLEFQRFLPQKPVAPGTPVVSGEPEDTDGTVGTGSVGGTTETDETKQKEAYEKALKEATEELENEFKENYRNVSSLNEVSPLSKTFEVNGKTYRVTVKPTYYKQDDGTYSLYNNDEMKMATGWKPKFEVTTDEISDNDKITDNKKGDVNVDYSCDKPANWKEMFGTPNYKEVVDEATGKVKLEQVGDARILYDGTKLKQHLPQDMIDRFFVEDETHKGGYKLAGNVKSVELVSNDSNGNPKYQVTYTDENGNEVSLRFDVRKYRSGLAAENISQNKKAGDVDSSTKSEDTDNTITDDMKNRAIKEAKQQLESRFPKTTSNRNYLGTAYVNLTVDGKQLHVTAVPTYIHDINEGTYKLQSIEYKIDEGNYECAGSDMYDCNIIEHKAVGEDSNVGDLKQELATLKEKVNAKLGELQELHNKISGKYSDISVSNDLFTIDENSSDSVSDAATKIEQATKLLDELNAKISAKKQEYSMKKNSLYELKQQADKLDEEEEKAMKLLDDLCEHYGVENTFRTKSLEATRAKDLDSQIEEYKKYIAMQKENIANINAEINRLQASDGKDNGAGKNDGTDSDISAVTPNLDMDKIKAFMNSFAARHNY